MTAPLHYHTLRTLGSHSEHPTGPPHTVKRTAIGQRPQLFKVTHVCVATYTRHDVSLNNVVITSHNRFYVLEVDLLHDTSQQVLLSEANREESNEYVEKEGEAASECEGVMQVKVVSERVDGLLGV